MKPRGLLMIEHRLIERMINIIRQELNKIRNASVVSTMFIDSIIDFIRTYADRTHHGKEEDILFKSLEEKNMQTEDKRLMDELNEEHKYARKITSELEEANRKFAEGRVENIEIIVQKFDDLLTLYPEHIRKEDQEFFPNAEKYFSEQELSFLMNEFYDFDKQMIHEKYNKYIEKLEAGYK